MVLRREELVEVGHSPEELVRQERLSCPTLSLLGARVEGDREGEREGWRKGKKEGVWVKEERRVSSEKKTREKRNTSRK